MEVPGKLNLGARIKTKEQLNVKMMRLGRCSGVRGLMT